MKPVQLYIVQAESNFVFLLLLSHQIISSSDLNEILVRSHNLFGGFQIGKGSVKYKAVLLSLVEWLKW
jgi:hypothetical protein